VSHARKQLQQAREHTNNRSRHSSGSIQCSNSSSSSSNNSSSSSVLTRQRARPRTAQHARARPGFGGTAARRPSYLKHGPGAGPARDPERCGDPLHFHEGPNGARFAVGRMGGVQALSAVALGSEVPRFCPGYSAGGRRALSGAAAALTLAEGSGGGAPPRLLYPADAVDKRAAVDRAFAPEPAHVALPLGATRTPQRLHPTMTAVPPHPDWRPFAQVDYQLDLRRQNERWTSDGAGRGVGGGGRTFGTCPPTLRGDPRRPECRMHTRVLLTRSQGAQKERRAERAQRGRMLRQGILDACGFYHSHDADNADGGGGGGGVGGGAGGSRVDGSGGKPNVLSRADFMGALHSMGIGLSFEQLRELATRASSSSGGGGGGGGAGGASAGSTAAGGGAAGLSKRAAQKAWKQQRGDARPAAPAGFVDLERFADSIFRADSPNAFLLPLLLQRKREELREEQEEAAAVAAEDLCCPEEVRVREGLVAHALTVHAEMRHRSRTKRLWETKEPATAVIADVEVANAAYRRHMEALEEAQKQARREAALAASAEQQAGGRGGGGAGGSDDDDEGEDDDENATNE
jgi:hypothetical protein